MKAKIALLSTLFLLISFTAGPCEESVRLTNGEWPPYTSQKLPGNGLISEIVTQAFALSGIKVEFTFFDSWKRCYVLAQQGRYDGSLAWARTGEREKDFYFSDPVISHESVLFHLKQTPVTWMHIGDLKNLRISITNCYFYGDEFDKALTRGLITANVVYKDITHFHHLFQGRTQVFPMDKEVGYHLLRSFFPEKEQRRVTHNLKPIAKFPTCLVISRQIPPDRATRLLDAFNRGVAHLRKTERYRHLIVQCPL